MEYVTITGILSQKRRGVRLAKVLTFARLKPSNIEITLTRSCGKNNGKFDTSQSAETATVT